MGVSSKPIYLMDLDGMKALYGNKSDFELLAAKYGVNPKRVNQSEEWLKFVIDTKEEVDFIVENLAKQGVKVNKEDFKIVNQKNDGNKEQGTENDDANSDNTATAKSGTADNQKRPRRKVRRVKR